MGITYVPVAPDLDRPVLFAMGAPLLFKRNFQNSAALGSDATYARATVATAVDYAGRRYSVISGEPRFDGARRSQQICYDGGEAQTGDTIESFRRWDSGGVTYDGEDVTFSGTNKEIGYYSTNSIAKYGYYPLGRRYSFSAEIESATEQQLGMAVLFSPADDTEITFTVAAGTNRYCLVSDAPANVTSTTQVMFYFRTTGLSDIERSFKIRNIVADIVAPDQEVPTEWYEGGYHSWPYKAAGAIDDSCVLSSVGNGTIVAAGKVVNAVGEQIPGVALMKEAAATNLWTNTRVYSGVSVNGTPNSAVLTLSTSIDGPFGEGWAWHTRKNEAQGSGSAVFWRNFSGAISTNYCHSAYVKMGSNKYIGIGFGDTGFGGSHYAQFDLSLGQQVGSTGSPDSYGIASYGTNGWYRIWCTKQSDGDGGTYAARVLTYDPTSGATNYVGDGTPEVYIRGNQVEVGTVPSSLIETSGAAVTRNTETLSYSSVPVDNETRIVVDGADSDTDDWDGTVDEVGRITSITVYEPGDRPA